MKAHAALLLLLALGGADRPPPSEPAPLSARAVPLNTVDPAQTEVGKLRYLGGIALASSDRRFGGLSGMRFLPDGRVLAVSDAGDWLSFKLIETGGRLTGAEALTITRMVDGDGQPMRGKAGSDAEALEIEPDGTRLVSFERQHRVLAYPPDGGTPRVIAFPDRMWLEKLQPNGGLEAVARVGDLRLFFAEDAGPGGINLLIQPRGRGTSYGRAIYAPPPGFKPTDSAALDERTVLVMNRSYSPLSGVSAILTRVPIDPRALTAGPPEKLAELSPPHSIDNMEAIAVRKEGGRSFIYMASDDNFSALQRTLVLKFELVP